MNAKVNPDAPEMTLSEARVGLSFQQKRIHALELKLKTQDEFLRTRQCADHHGKWERGRCLQCEIEALRKLVVKGLDALEKQWTHADRNRMVEFTREAEEVRRMLP